MIKFHLLGQPTITFNNQPITDFASEKELLLLCYLACNSGEHGRSQLAGMLWGEMSEERARANLSTAIYNLRKRLPDALKITRKTVSMKGEKTFWLDTIAMREAANEQDSALKTAVAFYRGLFLEGIYPKDAPELESWLQQERERWRLLALTMLDQLSNVQTQTGNWEAAITTLRRLLELEPWREESHRLLMRLLASLGRFNAALVQYETCRTLLQDELGIEPMAQTTAVYERIVAARQRSEEDRLPAQPTPLVGRAAEMGKLFLWLHNPEQRLISLVGPGGSGKTRLALTAAKTHSYAFLDGVCFVPLAEVEEEAGLIQAIAAEIGLTLTASEERKQLLNYFRGKEMLLILDNVEQIVEPTADLVMALLESAVRLRFIVTSRSYLQLRAESRLPLDGLPVPPKNTAVSDEESVTDFDAVRLFVQEAQRVNPAFSFNGQGDAIAALCRMVEGLPLAIELAAALVNTQLPNQLLSQVEVGFDSLAATMRDIPARHRGLRAVFDYSWQMLTPLQQQTLARLTVFHGGFSQRSAAAVAMADTTLLAELVTKSLVRIEATDRYSLHKIINQYALEQLEEREEAVEEHAAFFTNRIAEVTADLHGPKQTTVSRQLLIDLANIEAAWQTAITAENMDALLAMAPGLTRFYRVAGLFQAGVTAYSNAVARLASPPPTLHLHQALFLVEKQEFAAAATAVNIAIEDGLRDPALLAQAHLIMTEVQLHQGQSGEARHTLERALALAETAQVPWLLAQSWHKMGWLEERAGNYSQAEKATRQAIALYESTGDLLGLALAYHSLGVVTFRQGDMATTKEILEKALAVRRQVDPNGLSSARILVNLGSVINNLGQEEESLRYFQDALAVFQQTGDRSGAALASDMLGESYSCRYDFKQAQTYLDQALLLRQEIGQRKGIADAQRHLADLAIRLGRYNEAQQLLSVSMDTYQAVGERRSFGTAQARLALIHVYQGAFETAIELAKLAISIADEIGSSLLRAYGLSSLGHALRGQQKWEAAAVAYTEAVVLWQEWDSMGLKAEIEAALATVYYKRGRIDDAWPLLESAVNQLLDNSQPDCDVLGQLYLDCILLLQAKGENGLAADLKQQALDTLNRLAEGILQAQNQKVFLTEISANRHLFALDLSSNP